MKKISLVLALFLILTGSAFAAGTTNLNVQAIVQGTCSFNAPSYSMDFGTLDPAAPTGPATAAATLDFLCSNGTVYTMTDVSGARNLTGAVTATSLAYTIAPYLTTGSGTGVLQSVVLNGTIAQAAYVAALPDTYTETVVININP